jgi:hypothetical protein
VHVNNNDNMVPREHKHCEKLLKIRPFMESLRKIFLQIEPDEQNDNTQIPYI